MPLSVEERSRLIKNVVSGRKTSDSDPVTHYTSQLGVVRERNIMEVKIGMKRRKSSKNANDSNTRNQSSCAFPIARRRRISSFSMQGDKERSHILFCPRKKKLGKAESMCHPFSRPTAQRDASSAMKPAFKLGQACEYRTVAERVPATLRACVPVSSIENLLEQEEKLKSLPQLLHDTRSNDVENEWRDDYKALSEFSSSNSSITPTSHTKDLLDINEQQKLGKDDDEASMQPYRGISEEAMILHGSRRDDVTSLEILKNLSSEARPETGGILSLTPFDNAAHSAPLVSLGKRSSDDDIALSSPLPVRLRSVQCNPCHQGGQTVLGCFSNFMCRSLSLYDAFFLDTKRKVWLVDDCVLTRCLDYVGLLGYEVPQYMKPKIPWDHLLSPLVSTAPGKLQSVAGVRSRRWTLGRVPCSGALQSNSSGLFLNSKEAERWLSEQEYVVGAILLCCARASDCTTATNATSNILSPTSEGDEVRPCLSPDVHPILHAAAFVLECFPHWGGVARFVEAWERQVGLVIGTASPSHQRTFWFEDDGIFFSSDMEGGNLARVERAKDAVHQLSFNLWMEPDYCCEQRLWFRFAVAGMRPSNSICLRILNIQPNTKLYLRNGMRPVWRSGGAMQQWTSVENCTYRTINNDADGELTFIITPRDSNAIHVAFCVPYTYADLLCHISHWHLLVRKSMQGICFEERVLCHTPDGRKLHMLIITGSATGAPQGARNKRHGIDGSAIVFGGCGSGASNRFPVVSPYTQFYNGKKVVLMSARVHPGEVTASHGIHGAISFLLSNDPSAAVAREHFIFYIVPMLNPDGVSRGHSRLDQSGFNLNRCYNNPDPETQPTVNALCKTFEHLRQTFRDRFFMYMDFHSHASRSSGFIFGNQLSMALQHWNMVFPKIVSLHAKDVFSYSLCRFGRGHMTSKEGSSRVLFGGSLTHSYTVELTHFSDHKMYVDGGCGGDDQSPVAGAHSDSEGWEVRYANTQGRRCKTINDGFSRDDVYMSLLQARSTKQPRERKTSEQRRLLSHLQSQRLKNMKHPAESCMGVDALYQIETPCILSQSAEVGRACVLALLDYCAVENSPSIPFAAYGGMERVVRDVKRGLGSTATTKLPFQR